MAGPKGPKGPSGSRGATGDAGADGPAGPAGIAVTGAWSSATAYAAGAIVTRAGGLWRARAANTAVEPGTDGAVWSVVAAKGETGDAGPDGARGDKGPDGDRGPKGPQGFAGTTGADGERGETGLPGVPGVVGQPGVKGPIGDTGPAGAAGANEVRFNGGYFVLTTGTFDGNLGGRAGANAKCLADLTSYPWTGRADAESRGLLRSTHVRAFICDGTTCQNPVGTRTYRFVSPSLGYEGVDISVVSGAGPETTTAWMSGTGSTTYWTGRESPTGTSWNPPSGGSNCDNWSSTASTGTIGTAESENALRWFGSAASCAIPRSLFCVVHP